MIKSLAFSFSVSCLVATCLFSSCRPYYVWVPDPIDPRLPRYTEKGYNTAGAMINKNDVWISEGNGFTYRSKTTPRADTLAIILRGNINGDPARNLTVLFSLKNTQGDFYRLKGKVFAIDGTTNQAFVYSGGAFCSSAIGQIYVRNVQAGPPAPNVHVLGGTYVSGTFSLTQYESGCGAFEVTSGRFDYTFY